YIGVQEREEDEKEDGAQDWIARAKSKSLFAENENDRYGGDIHPHTGGECFAQEEEAPSQLTRALAEGIFQELIGRIYFAFQVMRNHDDGENDAGDHVPDDDLNETDIAAISDGRHSDDGDGAGFGRDA